VRISDSEYVCDRCGGDCGNGSVHYCTVVSQLDRETNTVVNRHFCEDREEDGKKIKGCAGKVFSAKNLEHIRSVKEKENN
jgi:hypothetical protein